MAMILMEMECNLLERAFGGDSPGNDAKSSCPRESQKVITMNTSRSPKSVMTSTQVTIRYLHCGRSTDNRTWSESLVNQTAVSERFGRRYAVV